MTRKIFYFLVLVVIVGCSSKKEFVLFNQVDLNQSKRVDSNQSLVDSDFSDIKFEYKIVPHDRVAVTVYEHPEFSTQAVNPKATDKGILVNSKGDIRLPLVKSIHIAGLTQTEALNKIESAFGRYLKSPDIYFEVLNKRAYIIGEVKKPGEIELVNEKLNLIQILAKAGDLTDFANRSSILILRNNKNRLDSEVVDLTDINSIRTANLTIRPNDVVYVMPNDMKAFNAGVNEISPIFRLIGSVLSPFVSIKYLADR